MCGQCGPSTGLMGGKTSTFGMLRERLRTLRCKNRSLAPTGPVLIANSAV